MYWLTFLPRFAYVVLIRLLIEMHKQHVFFMCRQRTKQVLIVLIELIQRWVIKRFSRAIKLTDSIFHCCASDVKVKLVELKGLVNNYYRRDDSLTSVNLTDHQHKVIELLQFFMAIIIHPLTLSCSYIMHVLISFKSSLYHLWKRKSEDFISGKQN